MTLPFWESCGGAMKYDEIFMLFVCENFKYSKTKNN